MKTVHPGRWRAKLEKDQPAKIVPVPPKWQRQYGRGTMLISRPIDVDWLIRKVRKGRLTTPTLIRERLARDYGAENACPLCTGIFIRIVAEAAEEDRRARKGRITPYWRVVQSDGSLYTKFPGSAAAQARHLRTEGFVIAAAKGRKPRFDCACRRRPIVVRIPRSVPPCWPSRVSPRR
ncbi:MAG: hypothetical protein AB1792_01860 [Candidatus Zixiibacteriota bacterium]